MSEAKTRVVIAGAGFGGLSALKKLAGSPLDVTIVDRNPYSTFAPLMYQVATALIPPENIEFPIDDIVERHRNARFVQGAIRDIDLDNKVVHLEGGDDLEYDYVIIGLGTTTNFYGNKKVKQVAFPMKSIAEAVEVRRRIIDGVIGAKNLTSEERRKLLNVVIVGGGPTGVEFAGALAVMAKRALPKRRHINADESSITLVEGSDALLGTFPKRIQHYTKSKLERLGVNVHLGDLVTDADDESITLKSGARHECKLLFWAAGTKNIDVVADLPADLEKGRIPVDDFLQIKGYEDKGAYAIGDNAAATDKEGKLLPQLSPAAMQEGRHVAENVMIAAMTRADEQRPFRYIDKGSMATVSRSSAVADVKGLTLTGKLGKAAWAGVHMYYLAGVANRLHLMRNWYHDWRRYDIHFEEAVRAREAELAKEGVGPIAAEKRIEAQEEQASAANEKVDDEAAATS